MPRSPEQVEQIEDERRRAARLLFARKGFAAAKIADVPAMAGISHGLVYHYFSEKDSLFNAAIEASVEGWETLTAITRSQPGTHWDRLVFICTQMIAGLREEPEHLLMLVHAYAEDAAPAAAREALKPFRVQVLDDLARTIEAGQREGLVASGSLLELSRALIAIIQGLALNRLAELGAAPPPLDVVLRIVKAP